MTIRTPLRTRLTILGVASLALTALTACASPAPVDPTASIGYTKTFQSYEDASGNWKEDMPAWVPTDSKQVQVRALNTGGTIILRADTHSDPVGEDCVEGPRTMTPDLGASWIPAKLPETVLHCGGYEIITVDGGLLGWYIAPVPTPEPTAEG